MAVDIIARAMTQGVKTELLDKIQKAGIMKKVIVEELPTEDISTNIFYLVPSKTPSLQNIYDEYINLDGTEEGWELLGTTEIDLDGYLKIENLVAGNHISIEKTEDKVTINNSQKILMDFPDYVVTDRTMDDLVQSLDANNLPTGNIYLGGITCVDLPENMIQAELKIEAIKNSDGLSIYYFTISSTNTHPYLWTATGFRTFSGWQARPLVEDIPTKISQLSNDDNFVSDSTYIHTDNNYTTEEKTKLSDLPSKSELETNYIQNTNYATLSKAGVVRVDTADDSYRGVKLDNNNILTISRATKTDIDAKTSSEKPIVPINLDYAVRSVSYNSISNEEVSMSVSLILNQREEKRFTTTGVEEMILTTPVDIPDNYECGFCFKSGLMPTTLTYSATPIIWKGADCDSSGDFIPSENKIYEVSIKCVGRKADGDPIVVARVGVC